MSRLKLAVVGLGRLGLLCAKTILAREDLALAGIVRRPESLERMLPAGLSGTATAAHLAELSTVDAALLCLPPARTLEAARDSLQHGIPIVECSATGALEPDRIREELTKLAARHHAVAVLGAGWDPGALTLVRALFALLEPKGHTTTTERPGVSLHHSAAARAVPGVEDALAAETRSAAGGLQRYVYVELEPGADADRVIGEIRADPAFVTDETFVFPVGDLGRLEDEGHGIVIERRGSAAGIGHQLLLLEARFDRAALAAETMLAAARALPRLAPGAYTLLDLPLRALSSGRSLAGKGAM